MRNLKNKLGSDQEVAIQIVDRIPRGANGKFRAVVSACSSSYPYATRWDPPLETSMTRTANDYLELHGNPDFDRASGELLAQLAGAAAVPSATILFIAVLWTRPVASSP